MGCGLFDGISVGSLDGTGDGGGCGRRVETGWGCGMPELAAEAAATAFAADVVLVVASLGILFGPCAEYFVWDAMPVPVLRMTEAPAVDLVTRAGRCSDAVTPRDVDAFVVLSRFRTGATPNAGRTSSVSSSSESCANRLAIGVFRGWPGGAMMFAFAVADAICLLGVTGGRVGAIWPAVGVVCIVVSSSVSAGGVAGVTSDGEAMLLAA